ncbi:dihydrodipicolinate synthase family protein [Prosthecomicrobium pneumaticum]|uniref:4-hydroxy-tetrahydrodipicolinate synthase n=1 Tax=Prosthecomicrobium pneumaticum TaxID=81895 RepID=A0A7W9CU03_9HYPH|nr:dihydrodipicolinate synthase family protein [Prosthecomicrobium pneumaticum]MBB5751614.1 4-hydroxy-tetrahydrodipicolinate synthase [Prosthecomicrobium pneumaticum]
MPATPGFSGIHAVLYAFFDADERLDRTAMRRQVETMLAAGVDGIVVNGLATEVAKLSEAEKRTIVAWAAEDIAGRAPLGVTVTGGSVAAQTDLLRHAEATGAHWVILQPPAVGSYAAAEYIRFFGRVAAGTSLPVAIQNAPAYLGRGLSAADIAELTRLYPNIRLLKGEGPAVEIERLIATTEGRLPVFNGRGGLELVDNLRAGCAGFILAPDLIDVALAACRAYRAGDEAGAEDAYRRMLPAACFVMQSLETLICYGKRLFAARAGLAVHDRAPALAPTEFGLARVAAYAEALGPLHEG